MKDHMWTITCTHREYKHFSAYWSLNVTF